ncbi:MAG TPA: hypothetical protein VNA87_04960 [Actinomycetota bacterium]|nr:hypothetical protein [Actinomycetota bacterium]
MIKKFTKILALGTMAIGMSAVFPAGALPPDTDWPGFNSGTTSTRTCRAADSNGKAIQDGNGNQVYRAGRTISYAGPAKLWPPNHKFYPNPIGIVASSTDRTDRVTLDTEAGHDQAAEDGTGEMNGSGNTGPDRTSGPADKQEPDISPIVANATGTGTAQITNFKVRVERSGQDKTGRTYWIDAVATFDGEHCLPETFNIIVPHDMRPANRKAVTP